MAIPNEHSGEGQEIALTRLRDMVRDSVRDAARDVLRDELRLIIREELQALQPPPAQTPARPVAPVISMDDLWADLETPALSFDSDLELPDLDVQNEVFKFEHPLNTPPEPQNKAETGMQGISSASPILHEHLTPLKRATRYSREHPEASVRDIARETGVSIGTAQKAKKEARST